MQSLAGSIGVLRRNRVASAFSAWRRWRYPYSVRGDAPLISAASANLKGDPLHSRFVNEPMQDHTIIKDEEWPMWDYALGETGKEIREHILMGATEEVTKSNPTSIGIQDVRNNIVPEDNYRLWHPYINPKSRHRDGTIYKKRQFWKNVHSIDFTDRSETRLDPMRYSVRTSCGHDPEYCMCYLSMLQIFSLKLAEISLKSGSGQLYGYIAARDDEDSMLNYVFYRSRDDPITVHQDSLIEMTGPKRGITQMGRDVIFEFDMRIKNGEQEEDDLQLIDGLMKLEEDLMPPGPFTVRINNGKHGTVDMCLANIDVGVEATVEVVISDVQNNFDLSLSSEVASFRWDDSCTPGLRKEFQLFCGAIGGARRLRRFVLAVFQETVLQLKFKVYHQNGSDVVECGCSFGALKFGTSRHRIDLDWVASIEVKVTWSTMHVHRLNPFEEGCC